MNNKIFLVLATAVLALFGSAKAEESNLITINGQPGTYVQVMASYVPLEYVSGGIVTIHDSRGGKVAQGKTNTRGAFTVPLTLEKFKNLPLTVTVAGGRIISQSGDLYKGSKFNGRLRGKITTTPDSYDTPLYLDIVTTVASIGVYKKVPYDKTLGIVRHALGIDEAAPVQTLRYKNNYVGTSEMKGAIFKSKGYDRFAKRVAKEIRNGRRINGLTPLRVDNQANIQGANDFQLITQRDPIVANNEVHQTASVQSNSGELSPVCVAPLPDGNTDAGKSSSNLIDDFGVIGAKDLMNFVGIPSTGIGDEVVGMLLQGGSKGVDPTTEALKRVSQQLSCITEQLNYLVAQSEKLALSLAVEKAKNCSSHAKVQYHKYQRFVEQAMPNADGSPSRYPMDSSNPSFLVSLSEWGPGSSMDTQCSNGKIVNDMLFGDSGGGGQSSAWRQLNINFQDAAAGGYYWYTQFEVQQLQQFLSYWSTINYDVFILQNEYDNYYGLYQNAQIRAGNVSGNSFLCEPKTTPDTPTYCAYFSNIKNAYPANLYSDEIAIPDTGNAVVPYPAGLAIGVGQLGLNLSYVVNNLNPDEYYAKDAAGKALKEWNSRVIASGESSVETFDSPKTVRTNAYENDYWRLTQYPGPGGKTAASFLLSAINSSPTSQWSGLTSSGKDISFWTYDQWAHYVRNNNDNVLVALGSMVNREEVWADCSWRHWTGYCQPGQNPVMGVLLARKWWEGASTATHYIPPPPPTP